MSNPITGKHLAKVLHYYGLLGDGAEFKIICPFHADVNPSMKVNLAEGTFFCFGCNVSGNAVDFVKLANPKLNDLKAWHEFIKIMRSEKVKRLATRNYKATTVNNKQALKDAAKRFGELKETDWYCVYDEHYLFSRGYTPNILIENNVKISYSKNYPVIAPIMDNGVFMGTVSRTDKKKIEKKRKYLYNKGFKRQITVGGYYSKPWVLVTEGYFDFLKLRQNLFGTEYYDNIVYILGWKATPLQIEKLKQVAGDRLINCLDDTPTGKRGGELLRKHFKYVVDFQYDGLHKDQGELDGRAFKKCWLDTLDIVEEKQSKYLRRRKNAKRKKRKSAGKNAKADRKFKSK